MLRVGDWWGVDTVRGPKELVVGGGWTIGIPGGTVSGWNPWGCTEWSIVVCGINGSAHWPPFSALPIRLDRAFK
ncbi:hypothetical protein HZH68_003417 [Vespula germanica]|uniref:Uncharacterized protein n=1 Tax=Vespula germanica TaxID=30212 RepID=A0A834U3B4_VESGE|nr:hypothetical protein HZH68_003417 [Vespula germanica]